MKYVERYRAKSIMIEFIERLALTLDIEEGDWFLFLFVFVTKDNCNASNIGIKYNLWEGYT